MNFPRMFATAGLVSASVLMSSLITTNAFAADKKKAIDPNRETVAKPLTEKEKKRREDAIKNKGPGAVLLFVKNNAGYN